MSHKLRVQELINIDFTGNIEPEVLISREYDMKADIYSLGVIVRELFFLKSNS
jgi:hypothetical protein